MIAAAAPSPATLTYRRSGESVVIGSSTTERPAPASADPTQHQQIVLPAVLIICTVIYTISLSLSLVEPNETMSGVFS